MSLPIATIRPAPEPAPSPSSGGSDAAPSANDASHPFGGALANALHSRAEAARKASATRRTQAARVESEGQAREVASHPRSDDLRAQADVERRPLESASRGTAPSNARRDEDATASAVAPSASALLVADSSVDSALDVRTASAGIPATVERPGDFGNRAEATPGRAEPGEPATAGERESVDVGEIALSVAFVATSLEGALVPPVSLIVTSPPLVAATRSSGSPGNATTPAAAAGDEPTVAHLTERALRGADAEARRAAIAAAMARDPLAVRREIEALAPELRARLERVIDRMEQEYGYTVEVVETARTSERQTALYAQGRTEPGPIVTWTRNSRHLEGAAADVVVDGGYNNTGGFERLARVAREEGLRTLWPRDPGHIELTESPAPTAGSDQAPLSRPASGVDGVLQAAPTVDKEVPPLAIPKLARSAIDPSSGRRGEDARRSDRPISRPGDDAVHILPFPTPEPDRPRNDGDLHTLPLRPRAASAPTDLRVRSASAVVPDVAAFSQETSFVREGAIGGVASAQGLVRDDVAGRGFVPPDAAAPSIRARGLVAAAAAASGVVAIASTPAVATVATVATTATVASGARVATVARVAEVAAPGASTREALPATQLAPAPVVAQQGDASRDAKDNRRSSGDRTARDRSDTLVTSSASSRASSSASSSASPSAAPSERPGAAQLLAREAPPLDSSQQGSAAPVAGLTRTDATERIARVLRLQEAGNDRPLSSVMLRLDHPEGGEDRIRIDLRGRTIGATLDVADPRAAEQLRAHVPELQQALQRRGLEGEGMVVRSTSSRITDVAALNASAAAAERDVARAASATASDGGGSTAKDSRNQPRAQYEREGTDQQRSRQRRDGKGETR